MLKILAISVLLFMEICCFYALADTWPILKELEILQQLCMLDIKKLPKWPLCKHHKLDIRVWIISVDRYVSHHNGRLTG